MKRKYFKTKKEYLSIAIKRTCFLKKIKRRIKKISAAFSSSVGSTLAGIVYLKRIQKKKIKNNLKFFYFFKTHCVNHFSNTLRFFGDFFFINSFTFFFKNFIFFNNISQVVNLFNYESEEDKIKTIELLKEDYLFYSNLNSSLSPYEEIIEIKKKTIVIFLNVFLKKKKNFKINSFFFFLFFLKKIKKK